MGHTEGPTSEKHEQAIRAQAERVGRVVRKAAGQYRWCLGDGRQALPVPGARGGQPRIQGMRLPVEEGQAEGGMERRRAGKEEGANSI